MELFPPELPRETARVGDEKRQTPPAGGARRQAARKPEGGGEPYDPLAANRARLERLRQRKRRRRIRAAVVMTAVLACVLAYFTGLYGASIALLGDIVDSVSIALTPGDGFPLEMGLDEVLDAQPLAGGFAAVNSRELVMWSSTGRELRRIQHGYSDPCITAGNTRVCIYDRGSVSLRVEGRSGTLSEKTMDGNILLADMSPNGTLAVFTEKGLEVYSPLFELIWQWKCTDALPLALSFDSGGKKFAAALVEAKGGVLTTTVYLFSTGKDAAICTIEESDAIPVKIEYLSSDRILCVFDTRAVVCDANTGERLAAFEYGTRVLQSASVPSGGSVVLLFSDVDVSRRAELIVLDETLSVAGSAKTDTRVLRAASDRTHAYILTENSVITYLLDGTLCGETFLDSAPVRMVKGSELYLITEDGALIFTPPAAGAGTNSVSVQTQSESESASQAESSAASAPAA